VGRRNFSHNPNLSRSAHELAPFDGGSRIERRFDTSSTKGRV
jgi:hypothetical protein